MKKFFLLFVAFAAQIITAQNVFPENNNVGIGTSDPKSGLQVFKLNDFNGGSIRFGHSGSFDGILSFGWNSEILSDAFRLSYSPHNSVASTTDLITIGLNGNVGIGTSNPLAILDVYLPLPSQSRYNVQRWSTNNPLYNLTLQTVWNHNGINQEFIQLFNGIEYKSLAFFGGNLGVGTSTPSAKLEVYNTAQAGHLILSANDNPNADKTRIDIDFRVANQNHTVGRISSAYINSADGGSGGLRFFTRENGNLNEKMAISSNGNVGIGVVNPPNKLDVKGTIHSQEVKVDMENWSDFVFKKDYNLPTLEEVEKHIAEKGHLENIPSEEEVLKNGISLGEMNAKLLQKIEEMTLYMIEQNKSIEDLKKEVKILKTKI